MTLWGFAPHPQLKLRNGAPAPFCILYFDASLKLRNGAPAPFCFLSLRRAAALGRRSRCLQALGQRQRVGRDVHAHGVAAHLRQPQGQPAGGAAEVQHLRTAEKVGRLQHQAQVARLVHGIGRVAPGLAALLAGQRHLREVLVGAAHEIFVAQFGDESLDVDECGVGGPQTLLHVGGDVPDQALDHAAGEGRFVYGSGGGWDHAAPRVANGSLRPHRAHPSHDATALRSPSCRRCDAPAGPCGNGRAAERLRRRRQQRGTAGRRHARRLRLIAVLGAGVIPALVVALPLGPVSFVLAAMIHLAGAFAARWLFFAEAEHVVGLYYGAHGAVSGSERP